MFFLVHGKADAAGKIRAAAAMCAGMGFAAPTVIETDEVTACLYPRLGETRVEYLLLDNGDFAFASGTFIFRGQMGLSALRDFHARFDGDLSLLDESLAHFAVVLRKNGAIHVVADPFGGYHVFRNGTASIVSPSFLAAAAPLKHATVSVQSLYEFVFNGVVSGNETLFEELSLLPIGGSLIYKGATVALINRPDPPPREPLSDSREELLAKSLKELDQYFSTITRLFGDRISSALSGGYDSRLILAMLRRHGSRPRLYVYGEPGDADVCLARTIADCEKIGLRAVDKDASLAFGPSEYAAVAERNFYASDGYTWDGIFNNGAENMERAWRVSDGSIALNGGGGEIFRNFFFLPNRRYTPHELALTFYAGFAPGACTKRFDQKSYFRSLEAKMIELTGAGERYERPTIEWLYHRFRCRSWDGRTATINARFGATGMPFLDPRVTQLASRIPVRFKHHGAFETELIRRVDPALAAYPSNHGHSFSKPPPLTIRVQNLATYFRPPTLRRFTFRIKHRRLPSTQGYLAPPYVKAALPNGIEAMRSYFHLGAIADPKQLQRILTLEYLFQRFGSRVRHGC